MRNKVAILLAIPVAFVACLCISLSFAAPQSMAKPYQGGEGGEGGECRNCDFRRRLLLV